MTSFKRVTILLVVIFNANTITSLLEKQNQHIFGLGTQMSAILVAVILAAPIPIIMAKFYQRIIPENFIFKLSSTISGILGTCFCIILLLEGDEIGFDEAGGFGNNAEEDVAGEDEGNIDAHNEAQTAGQHLGAVNVGAKAAEKDTKYHKARTYSADHHLLKRTSEDDAETLCLCIKTGDNVTNHDLVLSDIIGTIVAYIIVFGCFFVICVLAYQARNQTDSWVHSAW
eukprot:CAMPEP_0167743298 /NCGR_PEP_ID=MMETSP0110_2-20121227/1937_1 /TAXON_ID=629695 /ORGANISM="Gymnochlora sp., Strain CCMP2014" /LENGTH=227 /DNA_ID=CAMNT_0007627651 /DNA_START=2098 /DNA_END=2778 /DNA_ORIENTATION=+